MLIRDRRGWGVMAKRKPNKAFLRPVRLSPALQAIVGKPRAPRTVVTKALWRHIKRSRGAQKGRVIHPAKDAKLKALLGSRPVDMLTMTKVVNRRHMKA